MPSTRRWWRWPRRRVAAVVMVLGLLTLVPVVVRIVHIVSLSLTGPSLEVPGRTHVHLESGRWIIFEQTGAQRGTGPIRTTESRGVTIRVVDVTVTSAGGVLSSPRDVTGTQTITRESAIYTGAVEFTVPADGDYDVDISRVPNSSAILARPVTDTFVDVARWALLGIFAVAAFIVGLVFVALPASAPPSPPPMVPVPGPPPGWYPDPYGSGQRWWSGAQWTEHTQGSAW